MRATETWKQNCTVQMHLSFIEETLELLISHLLYVYIQCFALPYNSKTVMQCINLDIGLITAEHFQEIKTETVLHQITDRNKMSIS